MDISLKSTLSLQSVSFSSINKSWILRNSSRINPVSSVLVAMPINPQIRICWNSAKDSSRNNSLHSSGLSPCLDSSCATWISNNTRIVRSCFFACLFTSAKSFKESMLWIKWIKGTISFTLLLCNGPIKCHSISSGSTFCLAPVSYTHLTLPTT